MSIIDTPIETLRKANQEANETRIKLNALKSCYDNVCNGLHTILKIKGDIEHDTSNYKDCSCSVCKANYDVLIKLGLS